MSASLCIVELAGLPPSDENDIILAAFRLVHQWSSDRINEGKRHSRRACVRSRTDRSLLLGWREFSAGDTGQVPRSGVHSEQRAFWGPVGFGVAISCIVNPL